MFHKILETGLWSRWPTDRRYRVSTFGEILSPKRQRMKQYNVNGYLAVNYYNRRKRKNQTQLVHCMVMETFVGPRPGKLVICHRDGNSHHNWLGNLYYGTQSENIRDTHRHGRTSTYCAPVVDEAMCIGLLQDQENGMSIAKMALKYGVSRTTISNTLSGKTNRQLMAEARSKLHGRCV